MQGDKINWDDYNSIEISEKWLSDCSKAWHTNKNILFFKRNSFIYFVLISLLSLKNVWISIKLSEFGPEIYQFILASY